MGLVVIHLFCLLIFILSVMELLMCKVNAVVLCQQFWQTASSSMYGEIIDANQAGKYTLTLHSGIFVMDNIKFNKQNNSGIFVMDNIKFNKQNNSVATEPLYVHSEFEAMLTLLLEVLNHMGYWTL